jgi:hypothetical protein
LPKGRHKVSGYHKLNVNRDKAPIDTGIAEAIKFDGRGVAEHSAFGS